MMIWKGCGMKQSPNFKVLSQHLLGGTEENQRPQDSRSLGQDLKPGPPEHKAGVLTT
jgi:hypothetical protein